MCLSLHGENGLFPLDGHKLDEALERYFRQEGAIIGVIGDVGTPVASIYLHVTQFFYTSDWVLLEEWAFVSPTQRRSNYAIQLINYAKGVSDGMKMPLITGILSNKRTEAKVRLYERQMMSIGRYFMHGQEWLSSEAAPAWTEKEAV